MLVQSQFHQRVYVNTSVLLCVLSVTILFFYLNRVHPYYFIDEAFHIPQVLRYCDGNFTQVESPRVKIHRVPRISNNIKERNVFQWDPKITTLPGLYAITALFLSPFHLCQTKYIRGVNLIGTFLNFYLVCKIIKEISGTSRARNWSEWMRLAVALNITFLPPLFFWHFLYYTDVTSVTAVLLALLFHIQKRPNLVALSGLIAVLIRQTNIIWLAFLAIERALNVLQCKMGKAIQREPLNTPNHLRLLYQLIQFKARQGPVAFAKFILEVCSDLLSYIAVFVLFLVFVVWNKGIVVGDKSAHIATVHVPQILYFSLFALAFSWPYILPNIRKYWNFLTRHWFVASALIGAIAIAVHCNTLVHPYVLADNRHYVFYFWNKLMGRYPLFKYALIPVYSFTLFAMYCGFRHLRFATQLNYILIVSAVLIPQLLLEPRYFILPYIFYRLSLTKPKPWQIIAESLTTLTVNVLQFAIFVNKVFYWEDQPGPQRISW